MRRTRASSLRFSWTVCVIKLYLTRLSYIGQREGSESQEFRTKITGLVLPAELWEGSRASLCHSKAAASFRKLYILFVLKTDRFGYIFLGDHEPRNLGR